MTSPPDSGTTKRVRRKRPTAFVNLARVHALNASANVAVAIALANSLFFSIDPQAARGRIILYLLLSMAPFTLVSPMIGPAIDRIRSGHRVVIITLMFGLALSSFGMIGRVQSLFIFPLAFAVLVFGKGYAVAKAAIVPATVKSEDELVSHNSRLAVLSGIMSFVGAGPALLASWLGGSSWAVGLAMLQFFWAAILAFKLPRGTLKSESFGGAGSETGGTSGEDHFQDHEFLFAENDGHDVSTSEQAETETPSFVSGLPSFTQSHPVTPVQQSPEQSGTHSTVQSPPHSTELSPRLPARRKSRNYVVLIFAGFRRMQERWRGGAAESLRINTIRSASHAMMMLRGGIGFLTFFLAFHFRGGADDVDLSGVGTAVGRGVRTALGFDSEIQGAESVWRLGALVFLGVAGGLSGSYLAPRLQMAGRKEERVLYGSLLLVILASFGAWTIGGLWGGLLIAFVLGFAAGAGKVAFDSIVQRDARDSDYGRSFAVFETRFQLIWVFGAVWPVMIRIPFAWGCILIGIFALFALLFSYFQRSDAD